MILIKDLDELVDLDGLDDLDDFVALDNINLSAVHLFKRNWTKSIL